MKIDISELIHDLTSEADWWFRMGEVENRKGNHSLAASCFAKAEILFSRASFYTRRLNKDIERYQTEAELMTSVKEEA